MHRKLRTIVAAGLTAALASAAAGCATAGNSSTKSASGTAAAITIAVPPEGNTLNPWSAQVSNFADQALYDTLTRLEPSGTIGPWLATSWTYSTPTTLVMNLRNDVNFTDGTHFNAQVVKQNLEYAKTVNPKNAGDAPYVSAIKSVDVTGQYQVKILLSQPDPDLPWGFSRWAGWMVSPKALTNPGSLTAGADGSGPYVIDTSATTAQQTYTFTPNPHYWAAAEVKRFSKITVQLMSSVTAMANAAQSGAADFTITPDPTASVGSLTKSFGGAVSLDGLMFEDLKGVITGPIANVKVRQAMNYAINRPLLLSTVIHGAGVVSGSVPFGPASDGYSSNLTTYYSYDPAKARQLLAAAGYPHGFSVKVAVQSQFAPIAEAMAGELRAVGINLELSGFTNNLEEIISGKWAMAGLITNLTGQPYSDVQSMMTPVSTYDPEGYSDPKISSLLSAAANTTSAAERTKIYSELASYTQQQAWILAPVLLKTGYAYNAQKIKVDAPSSVIVPDLWYLSPA
jgi:peptide/nickel transport system substrate-binding protein